MSKLYRNVRVDIFTAFFISKLLAFIIERIIEIISYTITSQLET